MDREFLGLALALVDQRLGNRLVNRDVVGVRGGQIVRGQARGAEGRRGPDRRMPG